MRRSEQEQLQCDLINTLLLHQTPKNLYLFKVNGDQTHFYCLRRTKCLSIESVKVLSLTTKVLFEILLLVIMINFILITENV